MQLADSPAPSATTEPDRGADVKGLDVVELFEKTGKLCFLLAYALVGDDTGAREVVRDAFLTLRSRSVPPFEGTTQSREQWICSIVRRQAQRQMAAPMVHASDRETSPRRRVTARRGTAAGAWTAP